MDTAESVKKSFIVTSTVILTSAFFYVFYQSSVIFLSAIIGVGISSLIVPFINRLENDFKVPRALGALTLLIFLFLVFTIAFVLIGSILYEQFDGFKENLPKVINDWEGRWTKLAEEYPKLSALAKNQSSSDITGSFFSYAALTISGLVSAGTGITLAAVIALFTSINAEKYYQWLMENLPEKIKERAKNRLNVSRNTLHSWFVAQLLDMAIVAFITATALWVCGIKYWALFGVVTGILVIIPYLGIVISVIFSACVIMVIQPDKIMWLLGVFAITQQIEGNLILPLIMRDQVKIPAAPLIFFMALFGTWFGILGVIVTPPLLAIAFSQYRYSKQISEVKNDEN